MFSFCFRNKVCVKEVFQSKKPFLVVIVQTTTFSAYMYAGPPCACLSNKNYEFWKGVSDVHPGIWIQGVLLCLVWLSAFPFFQRSSYSSCAASREVLKAMWLWVAYPSLLFVFHTCCLEMQMCVEVLARKAQLQLGSLNLLFCGSDGVISTCIYQCWLFETPLHTYMYIVLGEIRDKSTYIHVDIRARKSLCMLFNVTCSEFPEAWPM